MTVAVWVHHSAGREGQRGLAVGGAESKETGSEKAGGCGAIVNGALPYLWWAARTPGESAPVESFRHLPFAYPRLRRQTG